MRAIDLFEAILNEEFNDFKENFKSKKEEEKIEIVNRIGDVVVPSKFDAETFEKIETEIPTRFSAFNGANYIDAENLFHAISDNVKIVRDVAADKALMFIFKKLVELAENPKFAGILLINRNTGFVFNPVHPFNIFLLKTGKVNLPEKLDIFMFEFVEDEISESIIEDAIKLHTIYFTLFTKGMIENLEYSIKIYDSQKDFKDIIFLNSTNAYIEIEKKISKNFETILFPLQILSRGELVPYMGWGGITKRIKALSLFGNGTGNLKAYHYSDDLNVCTGNKSNESLSGWYTLSKINFNSTWFNDYLHENFQELFIAGHMLARDILLGKLDEVIN